MERDEFGNPIEQRPVAYDANGQPLYAAPVNPRPEQPPQPLPPPTSPITEAPSSIEGHNFDPKQRIQYSDASFTIHSSRAFEPVIEKISSELQAKHEASVQEFPDLNLSDGEYVLLEVTRHPVGLWTPISIVILVIAVLISGLMMYPNIAADPVTGVVPGYALVATGIMAMAVLVGLGGYAAAWVYVRNAFYVTNESVILEKQVSLFSKHEKTVSLGSIEDAGFTQTGLIQTMLDYGSIRLSTEGDEMAYRFQYVENPKQQMSIISNAIESFKNGRPVGG